jgi:cyclase
LGDAPITDASITEASHDEGSPPLHRTLIVARMNPADVDTIAQIFADSDAAGLPQMLGAVRRTLFGFHDVYAHLIEAPVPISERMAQISRHPMFQDVSAKLAAYVRPYDPGWRGPADSVARPFYSWSAE